MMTPTTTQRYALIDSHSGYLWGYATAADPITACQQVDQQLGEPGRTYTEYSAGARIDEDHYRVYQMPLGHVEVEDGQDAEGIARVEREGRLVARVVPHSTDVTDWAHDQDGEDVEALAQ